MGILFMVNLSMMREMAKANMLVCIITKFTKENGKIIKNMALESLPFKTVVPISVNGSMTNEMESVSTPGIPAKDTKESGIMKPNMVLEFLQTLIVQCIKATLFTT